jgi:hypothetical protein
VLTEVVEVLRRFTVACATTTGSRRPRLVQRRGQQASIGVEEESVGLDWRGGGAGKPRLAQKRSQQTSPPHSTVLLHALTPSFPRGGAPPRAARGGAPPHGGPLLPTRRCSDLIPMRALDVVDDPIRVEHRVRLRDGGATDTHAGGEFDLLAGESGVWPLQRPNPGSCGRICVRYRWRHRRGASQEWRPLRPRRPPPHPPAASLPYAPPE